MSVLRFSEAEYAKLTKRRTKPAEAPQAPAKEAGKADRWPLALRDQIVAEGLPEPYREFVFHPTRNWRFDLAWPDRKFACECDGGVHRTKKMFMSDQEKLNAATLAGWRYLRVSNRMVETKEALHLVRNLLCL